MKEVKAIISLPENLTRRFKAPGEDGLEAGIVPGSYLDEHFNEACGALLGETPLSPKLERSLPRNIHEDGREALTKGIEKAHLGPVRLVRALRGLGLAAQVPAFSGSEGIDKLWAKSYLRGYLKALRNVPRAVDKT